MRNRTRFAALWLVLLAAWPTPAAAHKLNVFASADGAVVKGYVYFSGNARARDVRIDVLDPAGEKVGETTTGADGTFAFEAMRRMDHRLVANSGDGHRAEFTVRTEELPNTLAAMPDTAGRPVTAVPGETAIGEASGRAEAIETAVADAVARQIRPLREQLDTFQNEVRWRDVLGGIGYIFGVTGVAFYILGRRRESHRAAGRSDS